MLKTIQITIEEGLLGKVDELVEALDTTRSAFIRELLERELRVHHRRELERLDEDGYRLFPPKDEEVEIWLGIQD
jgi:metal-responsive CopG/Arc/MetJ family transcriptional regulator